MQELRDAILRDKLALEQIQKSSELIANISPLTFER